MSVSNRLDDDFGFGDWPKDPAKELPVTGPIGKIKITIGPQKFSPIQYTSYEVGGCEIEIDLTLVNPATGTEISMAPELAYDLPMEKVASILERHFQFAKKLYWQRLKEANKQ